MYKETTVSVLQANAKDNLQRRVLDLESEVLGSILTGGNISSLELLLSRSKDSDANTGIVANFV